MNIDYMLMLKLIDRLRIRGVRSDYTRDEELKKLNKTIEKIKHRNVVLLHASEEEFSKLRQRNKQQLSIYRAEFNKLKAKMKDERRLLISQNLRMLLKKQLRRSITYCY